MAMKMTEKQGLAFLGKIKQQVKGGGAKPKAKPVTHNPAPQAPHQAHAIEGGTGVIDVDVMADQAPAPAPIAKAKKPKAKQRQRRGSSVRAAHKANLAAGRQRAPAGKGARDRSSASDEKDGARQELRGKHSELIGVEPRSINRDELADVMHNMRLNRYWLAVIYNGANAEGMTLKDFILQAVKQRASKLGIKC